jgi:hypothetical protein
LMLSSIVSFTKEMYLEMVYETKRLQYYFLCP